MAGYTKLFGSIVHSTIWREPTATRIVWITMLALKDGKGDVHASVPGLADAARVTRPECEDALRRLGEPDPDSSNKLEGGRRIIPIEGGWFVVSHQKYSRMLSIEERRERDAERKRVQRASASVRNVTDVAESLPSRSIPDPDPDPNPERDPERARELLPHEKAEARKASAEPSGAQPALKYQFPSDWDPHTSHMARALELGLTEADLWERVQDVRLKPIKQGYTDEDKHFMRELTWAARDKEIRKAKEQAYANRKDFETPGHARKR